MIPEQLANTLFFVPRPLRRHSYSRRCSLFRFLLLLAASFTPLFGASILNFQGETFDIEGAGQFTATLDDDSAHRLQIYCVDFNNFYPNVNGASYAVNISTLADLSNTRYGGTSESAFTYQTAPNGSRLGNAASRYAAAAWLISQYDLTPGANSGARDIGIQNAIWDLLDATAMQNTQGDWQIWMNAAAASGGLSNFRIFTTTDVAGITGRNRYFIGGQEMIGLLDPLAPLAQVPEPQSMVMLILGGLVIGLLRRGRS